MLKRLVVLCGISRQYIKSYEMLHLVLEKVCSIRLLVLGLEVVRFKRVGHSFL